MKKTNKHFKRTNKTFSKGRMKIEPAERRHRRAPETWIVLIRVLYMVYDIWKMMYDMYPHILANKDKGQVKLSGSFDWDGRTLLCTWRNMWYMICMIYDVLYMIYEIWYMMYDIWYMIYMVHYTWYMIHDVWHIEREVS